MTRALFSILAVAAMAALTGCAHHASYCHSDPCGAAGVLSDNSDACEDCTTMGRCGLFAGRQMCDGCGRVGCGGRCRGDGCGAAPGPPIGAITYPYYTVRGPRDFLARNPRPIGP
jgi:hypothetical protein